MKSLFIATLSAATVLSSISAFAQTGASLSWARSIQMTRYSTTWNSVSAEVEVQDFGYEKEVSLIASIAGRPECDFPMSFQSSLGGGKEIWSVFLSSSVPEPGNGCTVGSHENIQFKIRYRAANGKTYIDDNAGKGYFLAAGSGFILPENKAISGTLGLECRAGSPSLSGSIVLKNISPSKRVRVIYSSDGWRTNNVADAVYGGDRYCYGYGCASNPSSNGTEVWHVSVPGVSHNVDYALVYETEKGNFWLNNEGKNYKAVCR